MNRTVRVLAEAFEAIDTQLPAERDPGPSAYDFASSDLLDIVHVFETEWDDLPWVGTDPTGRRRVWISTGRVVAYYSVIGRLAPDGAIELVDIQIDPRPAEDPEAPDED